MIEKQTIFYERAGLTHKEAACLADITGRMEVPKGYKPLIGHVVGQPGQSMDRCVTDPERLNSVGDYVDSHPLPSN